MSDDPAVAHTLEFVSDAVGAARSRILEIGCGNGALAAALMGLGHEVIGVESDASRGAEARRRGVPMVLGSWPLAEFVDRERQRFDAVLFTRSLHHIHELSDALRAAADVLRPRGVLVVEDFAFDAIEADDVHWLLAQVATMRAAGVLASESASAFWAATGVDAVAAWRADHDHGLHPWPAIEAATRQHFADARAEATPYLFRYLHAIVVEQGCECAARVCAASLAAETRRATETGRMPIGRRLVARGRAEL